MRILQTHSSDKLNSTKIRPLNSRVLTGHSLEEKPPQTLVLVTFRMGFHVGGPRGALPILELWLGGRALLDNWTGLGRNSCGNALQARAGGSEQTQGDRPGILRALSAKYDQAYGKYCCPAYTDGHCSVSGNKSGTLEGCAPQVPTRQRRTSRGPP